MDLLVLPASKLPEQNTIRLGPLKALGPYECAYEGLKTAIHKAAAENRGA